MKTDRRNTTKKMKKEREREEEEEEKDAELASAKAVRDMTNESLILK